MEEWKTIDGFENYEVNNKGVVRSKDRIVKRNGVDTRISGKTLKTNCVKGYARVTIYNGNRKAHKQFFVHRLVAMMFIPNPDNLPYINHKDENKLNNDYRNLEWCTAKYNSNYGTSIHRRVAHQDWQSIADKQSIAVVMKDLDGKVVKRYKSLSSAKIDNHNVAGISRCCKGKLKTYHGYIWEYEDMFTNLET